MTADSPVLAGFLTLLFAVTAAQCVIRCLQPVIGRHVPYPIDRIAYLAHALMSAGMIAMLLPVELPSWPQQVLFTGGALWFLVLAGTGARSGHCGLRTPRSRLLHLRQAVMSATMVWMVSTMPMTPSHMSHMSHTAHPMSTEPMSVLVGDAVLGGYLLLSAVRWLSMAAVAGHRALRTLELVGARIDHTSRRLVHALRALAVDAAGHSAASFGMGIALVATVLMASIHSG